jgi:hypothetical protein
MSTCVEGSKCPYQISWLGYLLYLMSWMNLHTEQLPTIQPSWCIGGCWFNLTPNLDPSTPRRSKTLYTAMSRMQRKNESTCNDRWMASRLSSGDEIHKLDLSPSSVMNKPLQKLVGATELYNHTTYNPELQTLNRFGLHHWRKMPIMY